MPTYEYACKACGYKFEKFQSIMAPPLKKCPKCARSSVRRLITGGAGVIFKGSGFYQTDYRSKRYTEAAQKDSPEKKTPASETSSGPSSSKKPEVCQPDKK